MKRRQFFATPLTGLLAGGQALHAETSRAGFEPWGPPSAPSFETIGRRLHEWQNVHGDWMRLETIGKSVQGRLLYRVWLTDPNSESDNKERVLMTALHSGQEHSGATSVLTVLEWLLPRSPEAR